jgi:hypothetical protein
MPNTTKIDGATGQAFNTAYNSFPHEAIKYLLSQAISTGETLSVGSRGMPYGGLSHDIHFWIKRSMHPTGRYAPAVHYDIRNGIRASLGYCSLKKILLLGNAIHGQAKSLDAHNLKFKTLTSKLTVPPQSAIICSSMIKDLSPDCKGKVAGLGSNS